MNKGNNQKANSRFYRSTNNKFNNDNNNSIQLDLIYYSTVY